MEKGAQYFSEKYTIKYDRIVPKDTMFLLNTNDKELNQEDVKGMIGVPNGSEKTNKKSIHCDDNFKSLCSFNELISIKSSYDIDKKGTLQKPAVVMIKIAYDRIFFISVDSVGKNVCDTLLSLNDVVLLTRFSEKYFLNFKTAYGWEIMQMDVWENKFLSVRPFYFTSYDECSRTAAELASSAKNIYPNLKPILNAEKKVIGVNAKLDAKILLEKFKRSEETVLLLKTK